MQELRPCNDKTSEGKAFHTDPISKQEQLCHQMLCSDRKNPRSIYCGDYKQPNVSIIGRPRKGKTIHPIEDEVHIFYDPKGEITKDQLRDFFLKRSGGAFFDNNRESISNLEKARRNRIW